MRIALISGARDWYGGEEQARLLADGLRDRGHDVRLWGVRGSEFVARMRRRGHAVDQMEANRFDPLNLWRVRRSLRAFRPDVLHFNDGRAISLAGRAAWGLPIGVRIGSRRVAYRVRSAGKLRRHCDLVLCVSQHVADVCIASGVERSRLCVVYDGVDPQRSQGGDRAGMRERLGVHADETLFVVIGSLTENKGHADLLNAWNLIAPRRTNIKMAFVGAGPCEPQLRRLAMEVGAENRVTFTGYQTEIADYLAAADLFVMPSHSEGMCSSIVDAMFAARPIVATASGGAEEILGWNPAHSDPPAPRIKEEPTAWLASPRSPVDLARAIDDALSRRECWPSLGLQGKERAERLFSADRMIEMTLNCYEEAFARRAA